MAALRLEAARIEHIPSFLPRIRLEDRREVISATGSGPFLTLPKALAHSTRAWAAIEEKTGMCVTLVGVCPFPDRPAIGIPWAHCTRAIEQCPKEFTRKGIEITNAMHEIYPTLMNFVDERNVVHVRWLEWMGYKIVSRTTEHARDGSPFLGFVRIRNV